MNTQNNQVDNKLSLRASLKKENESLAARLSDSNTTVPSDRVGAGTGSGLSNSQVDVTKDVTKTNINVEGMPPPEVIGTPGGRAQVGKPAKQKDRKVGGNALVHASRDTASLTGKSKSKSKGNKKSKPEKMIRYELALPKNEDVAIDTLRADLAKATGWKASKSEIVRAAVQLFAEQKTGSMRQLLASVAPPPAKGRKKG